MNRALFLDRDGTLNYDCPYCHDPAQVRLYDDMPKVIRKYRKMGYKIIVITNQSGIGRGYYTESDMKRFNAELNRRLAKLGARVDAFYFCPHAPEDDCDCRKPKPKMVHDAARDFNIDIKGSMFIGDNDSTDGALARRLKMRYSILKRKPLEESKTVPDVSVVIAGGVGSRLRPITIRIPKPMVKVKGKPIIGYIMENLIESGSRSVVLSLGYKAGTIKRYVKARYGSKVLVTYAVEKEKLDTGGAVKFALSQIRIPYNDAVIMNGDDVSRIDLKGMYGLHCSSGADITIATRVLKDVSGSGVVTLRGRRITGFVEKPDPSTVKSHTINQGVYIFNRKALDALMRYGKRFSITKDFFEDQAGRLKMVSYPCKDLWFRFDTMERYRESKGSLEK